MFKGIHGSLLHALYIYSWYIHNTFYWNQSLGDTSPFYSKAPRWIIKYTYSCIYIMWFSGNWPLSGTAKSRDYITWEQLLHYCSFLFQWKLSVNGVYPTTMWWSLYFFPLLFAWTICWKKLICPWFEMICLLCDAAGMESCQRKMRLVTCLASYGMPVIYM